MILSEQIPDPRKGAAFKTELAVAILLGGKLSAIMENAAGSSAA